MKADQHSLNASVDKEVYRKYKWIVSKTSSVNKHTNLLLTEFVEKWEKENPDKKIPDNIES